MPWASLFNLHNYGPGSMASVAEAQGTVVGQASALARLNSVATGAGSMPLAKATRLKNSPAVLTGSGSVVQALPKARARVEAVIKVNDLSQDDVTGAVLEAEIESGYSLRKILRLMSSVLLGRASGGPGSPVFRDINNTKDRVTGTADSSGNRTAATYDPD